VLKPLLKKALIVIILLFIASIFVILVKYNNWRTDFIEQLHANSIVTETEKGSMQYASIGDKSTEKNHLLVLHGTPGGYDAGKVLVGWLELDEQTHVIVPSRPGYLNTSIDIGKKPDQAAEALIALLDKLDITKTTVLGWSGGGATAVALAQRYPNRIDGLVLLSARIKADDKYSFSSADDINQDFDPTTVQVTDEFWGSDLTAYAKWVGYSVMPDFLLSYLFPDEINNIELTLERLAQLSSTVLPPSAREIGRQNDYWQFASLPSSPQINITIPTLIIHSPTDASVDFEQAQYANKAIAKSELYTVENESHFSTMNAQAVGRFHTFLEKLRQ
jgi:pimeloyl-ACP methyl ester carboxylesterase